MGFMNPVSHNNKSSNYWKHNNRKQRSKKRVSTSIALAFALSLVLLTSVFVTYSNSFNNLTEIPEVYAASHSRSSPPSATDQSSSSSQQQQQQQSQGTKKPQQQAPTAMPISATTEMNTPVTFKLVGGCSYPNCQLEFSISSYSSHGTLGDIEQSGGLSYAYVTYTPQTNYAGSDSFSFRVTDTATGKTSSPAKVSITVLNKAPVASSLSVSVTQNIPYNIKLEAID
jgi:hypothetical protein